MSTNVRPRSIHDLRAFKQRGERFVMLTAYDSTSAAILDEAGVPILLVGDSLGMVMLGYDSTVPVTMEDMIHHTAAVRRGAPHALVVTDLPFGSFQIEHAAAKANAVRILKETGASAVKIEGGQRVTRLVTELVEMGVPVMGHLGLTPQSVNQFGGFKVQGRSREDAERIVADTRALEAAGAFAVVLECVPAEVGRRATAAVDIPTIGIGAGADTDGQVLVLQDMLGLTSGPLPRFVKAYADGRSLMRDAVKAFQAEVGSGEYPGPEHQY
ncbi:MAG TPA: 3-methyl-2-oxobutanoate hydroxymethyltransferase [Euzebyales bacterium]|nr:3-methyl-2-oxobutanoate hydroxymethyltransferase [Euzebyales bacterium]